MTNSQRQELLELIHALRVNEIDHVQQQRLEALVAQHPEAMRLFTRYQLLTARLEMELATFRRPEKPQDHFADCDYISPTEESSRKSPAAASATRRVAVLSIVGICTCLVLGWMFWPGPLANRPELPTLVGRGAGVEILDRDGEPVELRVDQPLASGYTVKTGSDDSFAFVRYPDATTVVLNTLSAARFTTADSGRKRIYLSHGVATADVAPQSTDMPMVISTPHASVRVLGTRLTSRTTASSTRVELEEGEVELVRKADGKAIRVKQGLYAEASSAIEPLTVNSLSEEVSQPTWKTSTRAMFLTVLPQQRQVVTSAHQEAPNIFLWNVATGESERFFGSPVNRVRVICASADGARLAIGGRDDHVAVLHIEDRKVVQTFPCENDGVRALAISADGQQVAFSNVKSQEESVVVEVYDVPSGERLARLRSEGAEVTTLDYSPDGTTLVGGTSDGRIVRWEVDTGDSHTIWPDGKRIHTLKFSPDGTLLAACDKQGTVRIWQTATWQVKQSFEQENRLVPAIAFSPDSRLLAVGDVDGQVRVRAISGEDELTVRAHSHRSVGAIAFASDEELVTSCHAEVALWHIRK